MAYRVGKRQGIVIGGLVVVLFIAVLLVWSTVKPSEESVTPTQPITTSPSSTALNESEQETAASVQDAPTVVDTANIGAVAIEPIGIQVSYIKSIPGFTYSIGQTENGTEYIDFAADQLIGTKCTDDTGVFASVIKNPVSDEDQTSLVLKTQAGRDTYGLSLPSNTCTADNELFGQYQAAFKDAFGLLSTL